MGSLTAVAGKKVYLDTNLFIYALEAIEPWFAVTVELLSSIDVGYATAVTSELTLAECLVKPYRLNRLPVVKAYDDLLRSRPYFFVAPISRDLLLVEASRLRAAVGGIRLPDAIHVATALKYGCDVFISNDQRISSVPSLEKYELQALKDDWESDVDPVVDDTTELPGRR